MYVYHYSNRQKQIEWIMSSNANQKLNEKLQPQNPFVDNYLSYERNKSMYSVRKCFENLENWIATATTQFY